MRRQTPASVLGDIAVACHHHGNRLSHITINDKATAKPAGTGEEGEIVALARSDEAFEGYWRRPDADARALRDGWYFTGDTGYFDADGDLFVTGRVDDMIITGGENVSPVEIERCLSLHPAVAEVAVVGLPDERLGKVIAAFLKRSGRLAAAELDEFCRSSGLANYKRPRRIVFVAEIRSGQIATPQADRGRLPVRRREFRCYVAPAATAIGRLPFSNLSAPC